MASPFRELRTLFALAAPLALTHLGNQILGAEDATVVGRLGEVELGAVGLGSGIYFPLAVVGLGLVVGFDPLVAQALGSGEIDTARRSYRHAARVALLATVPLSLLITAVVASIAAGIWVVGGPAQARRHPEQSGSPDSSAMQAPPASACSRPGPR